MRPQSSRLNVAKKLSDGNTYWHLKKQKKREWGECPMHDKIPPRGEEGSWTWHQVGLSQKNICLSLPHSKLKEIEIRLIDDKLNQNFVDCFFTSFDSSPSSLISFQLFLYHKYQQLKRNKRSTTRDKRSKVTANQVFC